MMPYLHKITVIDDRLSNLGGNGTQPIREDLDLPKGFGHVLQRSVEELNEVNEIKREGAISFALPKSPKNTWVLDRFEWASIGGQRYKALKVEVWVGHIQLRFDSLLVSTNSDRENQYDCQLVNGEDFWLEKADKTYLKDMDFGSFEYTEANVLGNMENNSQWLPGNSLVWFPLVDYGNGGRKIPFTDNDIEDLGGGVLEITVPNHRLGGDELPFSLSPFQVIFQTEGSLPNSMNNNSIYTCYITNEDKIRILNYNGIGGNGQHYAIFNSWDISNIRPFFSVPGTLIEGFKQIGWQLKGDILEHPDVKNWWDYILAKNFYATGGNESYYFFQAQRTGDLAIVQTPGTGQTRNIPYNNIIRDTFGKIRPYFPTNTADAAWMNTTTFKWDIEAIAYILVENTEAFSVSFTIRVYSGDFAANGDAEHIEVMQKVVSAGTTELFEITLQAHTEVGKMVTVDITPNNNNVTYAIKAGTNIVVRPSPYPKYIVKGSTHENAKMIAPDITLLDRLKGFVHLADLKIKTDFDLKTVHLYPAENTTYEGEPLEGFWKPTSEARDMTPYIEKDSRVLTPPTDEQPRFVHLKFQDSTDDYITDEQTPDEQTGLHGRTLDFGERFTGEDMAIENPLYEPTAEKQAGGAIIPALWDNTNSKESYNIKPRIVYGLGWVRQQLKSTYTAHSNSQGDPTDPYVVGESFWYFEGQYMVYVPYASQLPEATVFVLPNPPYIPNKNIVYGTRGNDLYNAFYTLDRFARPLLPEIAFLVRMELEGFTSEGFRHRWYIVYKGEPAFYRLAKLLNHETNNDESTEAVLLPEYIE